MDGIPVANPAPHQRPHVSRRGLLVIAFPVAFIALMATLVAFAWPTAPKVVPARWIDAGTVDALNVNQPVRIVEGRLWLVKLESREIVALSQRDTHPLQPCTIPWRPEFEFHGRNGWFRSPCSGSTWDVDGRIMFGPSPRSMDRYRVDIRDGSVFVDVATLWCGPGNILPGSPCKLSAVSTPFEQPSS